MIDIQSVTKSFGDVQVLKGINLHIGAREVVSVVGPSGAGKTTLLQIVGTLDKPDNGAVLYGGRDVCRMNVRELSRFRNREIGFVFQFHQLLPDFSALENVMIPALIAGIPEKEARNSASELLDFMGLKDRISHRPAKLSGGENQRVAVARALINHPSVVLADEPSGSLDSKNKEELHQLFFRLRDEMGQTFVIVTHDEHLASITDRTVHMQDGLILQQTALQPSLSEEPTPTIP
ncbi:MAG: ABC transporter ATP-binding protein [Prevotellaceae bacterium]|nr:ABC transporter ATP-binding protein [Prevotellaceae bacterium]MDD7107622.1 ABC transporter ATP-binding protein [Prevotellaceae bacterium]